MLSSLEEASGPPRERVLFEPHELRAVIEVADLSLRAAITLAVNAGLGNSDIGEARWKHIATKRIGKRVETRFVMPRGKTCRVCDALLFRRGKYCSECGSRA
ncbi:MAG: hypothetical protein V1790_00790 [Planctomycetota bacterium]